MGWITFPSNLENAARREEDAFVSALPSEGGDRHAAQLSDEAKDILRRAAELIADDVWDMALDLEADWLAGASAHQLEDAYDAQARWRRARMIRDEGYPLTMWSLKTMRNDLDLLDRAVRMARAACDQWHGIKCQVEDPGSAEGVDCSEA